MRSETSRALIHVLATGLTAEYLVHYGAGDLLRAARVRNSVETVRTARASCTSADERQWLDGLIFATVVPAIRLLLESQPPSVDVPWAGSIEVRRRLAGAAAILTCALVCRAFAAARGSSAEA